MPSVSDYLNRFADFLAWHLRPFSAGPAIVVDPANEDGTLDGQITFPDGCELHVFIVASCRQMQHVEWVYYTFHCRDAQNRCVVRFDNARHHRQFATFPHHIHRGQAETVGPHALPTGRDVVHEVASHHGGHL